MPNPPKLTSRRTRCGRSSAVQHDGIGAHAVAQQVDRRARGRIKEQCIQRSVEVAKVVGNPVGVGLRRIGQPEATPVETPEYGRSVVSASTTN